jgi:hypothetical protein
MSVEETYTETVHLLLFQNDNLVELKHFTQVLHNMLNWNSAKKCTDIHGLSSSYKTFSNIVCSALVTKGDTDVNRHCQFPFHQVYLQNTPQYKETQVMFVRLYHLAM